MNRSLKCVMRSGVALLILLFAFNGQAQTTAVFGSGPDSVFLVIEEAAFGSAPFVYEYQFTSPVINEPEDQADLLTGSQLLEALVIANPVTLDGDEHAWTATDFSFLTELSLVINGGTPTTVTADFFVAETSWFQWIAGGYSDTNFDGMAPFTSNPSDVWTAGMGLGFSYLTPGSALGLTFSQYDENFDPLGGPPTVIPEPSVLLMLVFGACGLLSKRYCERRRAKHAFR